MIDLNIQHHFIGGVYAKRIIFPKNTGGPTHKHVFDHMSILAKGKVQLTVDDEVSIIEAPAVIEIKKNKVHQVIALEESHWYCIHATDVVDPEHVDETLIMKE
jgi:quercetin dioxygenase-like cupin family protein